MRRPDARKAALSALGWVSATGVLVAVSLNSLGMWPEGPLVGLAASAGYAAWGALSRVWNVLYVNVVACAISAFALAWALEAH